MNSNSSSVVVNKKDTMDKRDLARLIDYYRMRMDAFERERTEWLEKMEGLKMTQEEQHRQEWELRRRIDEIKELQNALSESNIALNNERKHIINLTTELENAKIKTKEDRRRLMQLLHLAEPIEQTIKLYYDRRPEKLEKFSEYDPDSLSLMKSLGSRSSTPSFKKTNCKSCCKNKKCGKCKASPNTQPIINYRIPTSDEKQQIVRTVLLPNQETDSTLKEENEFLKSQLVYLKNSYDNHIFKLEEDRRLREEEIRLSELNAREKVDEMTKKNQKFEKLNFELTKDYMQLKYDSSCVEKKLYEEMETLKLQNEALAVSLKEVTSKTSMNIEASKNDYERKTKEITNVMRGQVKNQEENIVIIKEQYKQIQKIYTTRVKELESKLKQLTDKHKQLENRRNYEIEGYINEVNLMRKRLKSYEEYVKRLKERAFGSEEKKDGYETNKFFDNTYKTANELDDLEERLRHDYNNHSEQSIKNESNVNYSGEEMQDGSNLEMEYA